MKPLVLVLAFALAVAGASAATSIYAYYSFDGTMTDSSGRAGTPTGTPGWGYTSNSSCIIAPCGAFGQNASTGNWSVNITGLTNNSHDRTQFAYNWWSMDAGVFDDDMIWSQLNNSVTIGSRAQFGTYSGTNYVLGLETGSVAYSAINSNNLARHMWTVMSNATGTFIYKDGALDNSTTAIRRMGTGNHSFGWNSVNTNDMLRGIIDEFSAYNESLSATQVACLYNGGVGTTYAQASSCISTGGATLDITATDLYNGTSILSFNASVTWNGTTTDYTTTDGTIETTAIANSSHPANVTISANRYFDNATTEHATPDLAMTAAPWTLILAESYFGTDIDTFTVTYDGGLYPTTNGKAYIPLYDETAQVGVTNASQTGVEYSTEATNLTADPYLRNYTFTVYPDPSSFNIRIYSETTGLLLAVPINVTVSGDFGDSTNTTSNGTLYIGGYDPGTYVVKFSGSGYALRSYTATLGEESNLNLDAYLSTSTDEVQFNILNYQTGQYVPEAIVTMARSINGTWTTVTSAVSDITGLVQFNYDAGIRYRFTVTADGYLGIYDPTTNTASSTFYLDPILLSLYQVKLLPTANPGDFQYQGISATWLPTRFTNHEATNLVFTIASANGTLTFYNATVNYPDGGVVSTVTASGANSQGATLTLSFTPNATTFGETLNFTYGYTTTTQAYVSYTYAYNLAGTSQPGLWTYNCEENYGLGLFDRAAIASGAAILAAGLATPVAGVIAGGAFGLLVLGATVSICIIPWWLGAISILAGFMILAYAGGRQ